MRDEQQSKKKTENKKELIQIDFKPGETPIPFFCISNVNHMTFDENRW